MKLLTLFNNQVSIQSGNYKEEKSPFEAPSLPDEILLKIFDMLPVKNVLICQEVCKKWCVLGSDDGIWRNFLTRFCQNWHLKRPLTTPPTTQEEAYIPLHREKQAELNDLLLQAFLNLSPWDLVPEATRLLALGASMHTMHDRERTIQQRVRELEYLELPATHNSYEDFNIDYFPAISENNCIRSLKKLFGVL